MIVTLFGQSVQAFNTVESEQLETAQLVTSLIDRLQTADGHIPDDFTKDEIEKALENGYVAVTFGNTRLRTETAALYSLCAAHTLITLKD